MIRAARLRGVRTRRIALVLTAASMALIATGAAASAVGPVAVGSGAIQGSVVSDYSGAIIDEATGYCLGSLWAGPAGPAGTVAVMDKTADDCQKGFSSLTWHRGLYGSTGYYALISVNTQQCLDEYEPGSVATNTCNGMSSQQWYEVSTDGPNPLVNLATGDCLDSNEAGSLYADPCNWGSYQAWEIFR